jgi:hypothetical protein
MFGNNWIGVMLQKIGGIQWVTYRFFRKPVMRITWLPISCFFAIEFHRFILTGRFGKSKRDFGSKVKFWQTAQDRLGSIFGTGRVKFRFLSGIAPRRKLSYLSPISRFSDGSFEDGFIRE